MEVEELREYCLEHFYYEEGKLLRKAAPKTRGDLIGKIAGGRNTKGYWTVSIKSKRYRSHRIIFLMFHGYLPEQVDHKNII